MIETRNKTFAQMTTKYWEYRGTGQYLLQFILILFVIVFSQFLSGCTKNSNSLANNSDARLVSLGNDVCQDTKTGKMWQVGMSNTLDSLDKAKTYVENLEEGGYTDWRLPTVSELYDLYMIFDLHENGNCVLSAEGTYWSDEADLEGRVGTWELDDNCDPERRYIPKEKGKVRAIRM